MNDNIRLDVLHDENDDGLGAARGMVHALGGTLAVLLVMAVLWLVMAMF